MKKLSALLLVLFLGACGLGESDTSSDAGSGPTAAVAQVTNGSGEATAVGGSAASEPGGSTGRSSGPAAMTGTITATLTAPGFAPVTDSVPMTMVLSGSTITLKAEGRVSTATVNTDGTFTTSIPINEESNGVACTGTPIMEGRVVGDGVSGNISGTGNCKVGDSNIPVTVTGSFSA